MSSPRIIKAKDILTDIKAGMSNVALREKYSLTPKGLRSAIKQLVDAGMLEIDDVTLALPENYHQALSDLFRKKDRYYIDFELMVCDADDPEIRGLLMDIHEEGLRVAGIASTVDEQRTLIILGDEFGGIDPFEVEVQCKWVRRKTRTGEPQAGFRIVRASEEHKTALRRLISMVTGDG